MQNDGSRNPALQLAPASHSSFPLGLHPARSSRGLHGVYGVYRILSIRSHAIRDYAIATNATVRQTPS